MGTTCVFSVTIFLNLSVQTPRYFVQSGADDHRLLVQYIEGLETGVLIRQHLNGCHFVLYLMKITGAKFENYSSNIFGDILNFMIY